MLSMVASVVVLPAAGRAGNDDHAVRQAEPAGSAVPRRQAPCRAGRYARSRHGAPMVAAAERQAGGPVRREAPNSGTITLLARPRMPSVPKILAEPCSPANPARRYLALAIIGLFGGQIVQKIKVNLAPMMNDPAGGRRRSAAGFRRAFSSPPLVVGSKPAAGWGRRPDLALQLDAMPGWVVIADAPRGRTSRHECRANAHDDLHRGHAAAGPRRRVPRMFFDYADRGSYAEETLRINRTDLERIRLRQRVLVDVAQRDLRTTIAGEPASLPLALAPGRAVRHAMGATARSWPARAAQAAGIPFCLSTMSICAIEDVAAAVERPFWFQLYVMKDRGFVREMIERADRGKMAARWCSPSICRCWGNAIATCATA